MEGRPWRARGQVGNASLGDGSSLSWSVWVTRRGSGCVRFMWLGRSALVIARAFSQWPSDLRRGTMINCTILLLLVSGTAPLETELLVQADRLVGGNDAILVIDDTAIPKKGKHSVGVAAQYASA